MFFVFFKAGFKKPEIYKILRHFNVLVLAQNQIFFGPILYIYFFLLIFHIFSCKGAF